MDAHSWFLRSGSLFLKTRRYLTLWYMEAFIPLMSTIIQISFRHLFPFGIVGFKDDARSKALSFQKQAQYYLNIADHSFRYHHLFFFVVWNMIQRWTAHLIFLLCRSNFHYVAQSLTQISSTILGSLASKLEREYNFSNFE
ncbi:hypothetical protein BDR05DRAFT_780130 [Suillus weaverae]|nr:hypothetical protein BDR05DRAFT_780130 [Suillus weaverae]